MIDVKTKKLAEILKALGHPTRLALAKGLLKQECNVNKMVDGLNIPQATVSQHLSVLKAAKIIKGERRGVRICYQVVDPLVRKILSST